MLILSNSSNGDFIEAIHLYLFPEIFSPALPNYCHYGYPAINLTWVILITFIHLNKWGGLMVMVYVQNLLKINLKEIQ